MTEAASQRSLLSRVFVAAIILSVIATPLVALAIWRLREIKWGGVMWLIAFAD